MTRQSKKMTKSLGCESEPWYSSECSPWKPTQNHFWACHRPWLSSKDKSFPSSPLRETADWRPQGLPFQAEALLIYSRALKSTSWKNIHKLLFVSKVPWTWISAPGTKTFSFKECQRVSSAWASGTNPSAFFRCPPHHLCPSHLPQAPPRRGFRAWCWHSLRSSSHLPTRTQPAEFENIWKHLKTTSLSVSLSVTFSFSAGSTGNIRNIPAGPANALLSPRLFASPHPHGHWGPLKIISCYFSIPLKNLRPFEKPEKKNTPVIKHVLENNSAKTTLQKSQGWDSGILPEIIFVAIQLSPNQTKLGKHLSKSQKSQPQLSVRPTLRRVLPALVSSLPPSHSSPAARAPPPLQALPLLGLGGISMETSETVAGLHVPSSCCNFEFISSNKAQNYE